MEIMNFVLKYNAIKFQKLLRFKGIVQYIVWLWMQHVYLIKPAWHIQKLFLVIKCHITLKQTVNVTVREINVIVRE